MIRSLFRFKRKRMKKKRKKEKGKEKGQNQIFSFYKFNSIVLPSTEKESIK